jgi:DNA polymerase-1
LVLDGYEADDVIGTLATKAGENALDTYMVTSDKDYGQLVKDNVRMYKPKHGGGYDIIGPKEIEEKYGISTPKQVIDLLALMGDSADNFPGCPGVGEKTAVKLINQFGSAEELIKRTSELKGAIKKKVEEHTDDINISYKLATILTDLPIDLQLDQLKLKEPDEAKLEEIFNELEFKTLTEKFLNKNKKIQKNQVLQLD